MNSPCPAKKIRILSSSRELISSLYISLYKNEIALAKSIHIPIFNRVDTYEVCAYRVKLNVDENITSFKKEDYFKLWGIKADNDSDYIYDVNDKSILKTRFYTQKEYDILVDKKFDVER